LPFGLRRRSTDVIAAFIYWPLARVAKVLAQVGLLARNFPLAYYRDRSFYIMRNDALDRFGTRLEQRFTRQQIHDMLAEAGFGNIRFSENEPFWCAVAEKRLSQT
jgi:hypothetical protein